MKILLFVLIFIFSASIVRADQETISVNPISAIEQDRYIHQLNNHMKDVKAYIDNSSLTQIDVFGFYSPNDRSIIKKTLEKAFEDRDYEATQAFLENNSLMITLSEQVNRNIVVHTYQPENSATRLVQAILAQDYSKLEVLLSNHDGTIDDIVFLDHAFAESSLSTALIERDMKAVNLLLHGGANPVSADRDGMRYIASALFHGLLPAVIPFLDRGVNIDNHLPWPGGKPTLLSYSVKTENIDLLKVLLTRNANANLTDSYGWTPLMDAIQKQNSEMVQLLLPLSDPRMTSIRPVVANHYDKEFDRDYPLCDALFVAEQFESSIGRDILKAVKERLIDISK